MEKGGINQKDDGKRLEKINDIISKSQSEVKSMQV